MIVDEVIILFDESGTPTFKKERERQTISLEFL